MRIGTTKPSAGGRWITTCRSCLNGSADVLRAFLPSVTPLGLGRGADGVVVAPNPPPGAAKGSSPTTPPGIPGVPAIASGGPDISPIPPPGMPGAPNPPPAAPAPEAPGWKTFGAFDQELGSCLPPE